MLTIIAKPLLPGENDLLVGNEHFPLLIRALDFISPSPQPIIVKPPVCGWTHESLEEAVTGAEITSFAIRHSGANAYLSTAWIGSTEI